MEYTDRYGGSITGQIVSKWEAWPHGHKPIQPGLLVLQRLATIYHTTAPTLLAAIEENRPGHPSPPATPALGRPAAGSANSSFMEQRPAWTKAAASIQGRPGASAGPTRPTTIVGIEQVAEGFRQMYHASAGADILPGVAQHAELVRGWFRASSKASQRQRLGAAAGEITLLAGRILFFDRDDHPGALPYYNDALGIAEDIGDEALQACALAHLSRVPATRGRVQEALDFLDGAQRLAARHGSALLQAWVAAVAAKTHATGGEVGRAKSSLDSSKGLLSQQGTSPDPVWLDYFDWSRLYGFEGFCLRRREPAIARAALRKGLDLLEEQAIKERACLLADLAATYLAPEPTEGAWPAAEIEESCRIASQSVALLAETGYATGLQRVDELRGWLLPRHTSVPAVRELTERLHDLRILKARSSAWMVDG